MSILSAIKSADYGKYIARGVGAAALYLCARDAHVYGKIQADAHMKTCNAKAAHYYLNNSLTLDKPSTTKRKLQDGIFRYELSENLRGFVNSFLGYFKGLGSSLISDVIPLGLGLTALLAKGRGLKLAKASGIGLGVMALYSIIKDGFGIGKSNDSVYPTE